MLSAGLDRTGGVGGYGALSERVPSHTGPNPSFPSGDTLDEEVAIGLGAGDEFSVEAFSVLGGFDTDELVWGGVWGNDEEVPDMEVMEGPSGGGEAWVWGQHWLVSSYFEHTR
jgi:hypothetical protein